jgi:hypothetical protein
MNEWCERCMSQAQRDIGSNQLRAKTLMPIFEAKFRETLVGKKVRWKFRVDIIWLNGVLLRGRASTLEVVFDDSQPKSSRDQGMYSFSFPVGEGYHFITPQRHYELSVGDYVTVTAEVTSTRSINVVKLRHAQLE